MPRPATQLSRRPIYGLGWLLVVIVACSDSSEPSSAADTAADVTPSDLVTEELESPFDEDRPAEDARADPNSDEPEVGVDIVDDVPIPPADVDLPDSNGDFNCVQAWSNGCVAVWDDENGRRHALVCDPELSTRCRCLLSDETCDLVVPDLTVCTMCHDGYRMGCCPER